MNNENNYKRLMILTVILLVLVLGMSAYILIDKGIINFSSSSETDQQQISKDEEAKLQEMIDKTVFGKILEISDSAIKIETTEPASDPNSEPKTTQKEIKIDSNTKFKKYEPVENAQGSYQTVDAKISDFKKDDFVSIEVDKKSSESDLVAVSIDLVTLPEPENPQS